MSNLLHNLLARSLGRADVVQPLIAPRFAPSAASAPNVAEVVAINEQPQDVVQQIDREPPRTDFVQPPDQPQPADRSVVVPPNTQAPQPKTVQPRSNDQQQGAPTAHFVLPEASRAPVRSDKVVQPTPQPSRAIVPAPATNDRGTRGVVEGSRPAGESRRIGAIEAAPPSERRAAPSVEHVRAAQIRADVADPHEAPAAPTIQVTIGRIEVRAVTPPAPQQRAAAPGPALSLDEYLRGRNGGPR